MTLRNTLIILILPIIYSCNFKNSNISTIDFKKTEIILRENLNPTSPIISFSMLKDGTFVGITETREIVHYSSSGEQLNFISNFGQGEKEVYSPHIIKSYKDGYIIWDKDLLKMIEYNNLDEPINEYNGFDHAVKDFVVDKNYIYTYISPLPSKPFIQIYDKTSNKIIESLGNAENEQVLANLNVCAGGISLFNDTMIFLSSTSLNVFQVNTKNINDIKVKLLNDESIVFNKFDGDPVDLINTEIQKAIQISLNSSIVTGVYKLNDKILIKGETGIAEVERGNVDLSNRYSFMLLLNEDYKIVGKYFEKYDVNILCKLWSEGPNEVARIVRKEGEDEYNYVIELLSYE